MPRNRDGGDRACLSKSPLEHRLSQARGNVGKSARDRQPRLPRGIKLIRPKVLRRTIGETVNFESIICVLRILVSPFTTVKMEGVCYKIHALSLQVLQKQKF